MDRRTEGGAQQGGKGAHLGSAKASVGGVAGDVGLAAVAHHAHIGNLVGCVSVQQGAIHDGCAQVQGVARVVVQLAVQGLYLAVLVESHLRLHRQLVLAQG